MFSKCFWGHKWGKWEFYQTYLTHYKNTDLVIREEAIYKRACSTCGKVQVESKITSGR